MRHGAVLVHAPGLAASRVEEAAGRSWASATGRAAPPEVSIRPRGRGKGYRGGSWTPPGHRAPPAPRSCPTTGHCSLRGPHPDTGPSSCPCTTAPQAALSPPLRRRGRGPACRGRAGPLCLGVKPPRPCILSSPANSGPSGWLERVASSHSPLAGASHCEARATRISTSLYREQGPPVFWLQPDVVAPHLYTGVRAHTQSWELCHARSCGQRVLPKFRDTSSQPSSPTWRAPTTISPSTEKDLREGSV